MSKFKVGDVVKVMDSSYSIEIRNGVAVDHTAAWLGTDRPSQGDRREQTWKVLGVMLDLPRTESVWDSHRRNDTLLVRPDEPANLLCISGEFLARHEPDSPTLEERVKAVEDRLDNLNKCNPCACPCP